jgi:predicted nucleotidyltransferase
MLKLIQDNRDAIAELCRRYDVRCLALFGSAACEEFDPAKSDLDFLVAFQSKDIVSAAEQFFGLLHGLEALFKCKVDLVDVTAHRNPYFMAEALRHREMLYAA